MAKILIVDDESEIVELIRRYAQRGGYETSEAYDGAQAVEACKNEDFDMIIMDGDTKNQGYTCAFFDRKRNGI